MTNIAWARDGWIGRFHKLVEIPHKILRGLPKMFSNKRFAKYNGYVAKCSWDLCYGKRCNKSQLRRRGNKKLLLSLTEAKKNHQRLENSQVLKTNDISNSVFVPLLFSSLVIEPGSGLTALAKVIPLVQGFCPSSMFLEGGGGRAKRPRRPLACGWLLA